MAGWHLQGDVNDWNRSLPVPLVKATSGWERFAEVKAVSQNTVTVHRIVRDDLQHYDGNTDWETLKSRARVWFNTFIDGTFRDKIQQHCDAVSWHNEIWANSQTQAEREERIDATAAAVVVWNEEYRPTLAYDIPLIIGEAAVGNWMPREIAEMAIDNGCWLGYHPYDYWTNKQRADEGWIAATSMLFDAMEYDWQLNPTWVFTEYAPLSSAVSGWRYSGCLDGDVDLMIEAVRIFIGDVAYTPAYKQGRIKGFAMFTSGGGSQWDEFEIKQPEMDALSSMFSVEWKPGSEEPMTNATGIDVSHWQGDIDWAKAKSKGVSFAFIKATEGTSLTDDKYLSNATGAFAQGILTGPYHFFRPGVDAAKQVEHFVAVTAGQEHELPHALDVEVGPSDPSYKVPFANSVIDACLALHSAFGRKCFLYTSPGFYNTWLSEAGSSLALHADLWLAHWTSASNPIIPGTWPDTWTFWQYSNSGVGSDYGAQSSTIDLNRYASTEEDLRATYTLQPEPCRGAPRENFRKVYWLLHQNMTESEQMAVFLKAMKNKTEVGWSADSAGLGDLANRAVVCWNYPESEQQQMTDWFNQWYPGVVVRFRSVVV